MPRTRGAPDQRVLADLASKGFSLRQVGAKLGCSHTKIAYHARRLGIEFSRSRPKTRKTPSCGGCGESDPTLFYPMNSGRCISCCKTDVKTRMKATKRDLVKYKGGSCKRCGYNACLAALEFHHTDRTSKDHEIGALTALSLDAAKREVDKCDLVCANCHREIHAGTAIDVA